MGVLPILLVDNPPCLQVAFTIVPRTFKLPDEMDDWAGERCCMGKLLDRKVTSLCSWRETWGCMGF